MGGPVELIGGEDVDQIISGAYDLIGAQWIAAGEESDPYSGADSDDVNRLLAAASSGDSLAVGREINRLTQKRQQQRPMPRPQGIKFYPPNARVVQVKEEKPTRQRKYPLGFNSVVAVPAGGNVVLTQRPQVIWRGERLIIAASIAGSFDVVDLKIGKNSQFAASGSVPGDMFTPDAVGVELHMDTATPGQDVFLSVQNVSGAPLVFRGSIIGVAVE